MGAAENPSGATMVDAQFTNARVLQPPLGFEANYQGKSTTIPIAFPGTRDPRTGQSGIDPNLMEGYPVPQGARVLLWFPMCFTNDLQLSPFRFYSYRLIWRYKNLTDYRNPPLRKPRAAFHFPRQSPGAPDTTFGPPLPRVTLPASWHVIAYEQSEPTTGEGELVIRIEKLTPKLDTLFEFVPPLLPDGKNAAIEQGVVDPQTAGSRNMPIFVPFFTDAEGDEIIILAQPEDSATNLRTWDFTSPALDEAFSNIYGTGNGAHPRFRDIGIYLQTGTNP